MNLHDAVEELISKLKRRFGSISQCGKSRIYQFGNQITCSINYSKLLRGEKYFFGLSKEVVDPSFNYPITEHGEFALFVCGTSERVVVLPRAILLEMMSNVLTRKLDIFVEDGSYILQTTKHPKLNISEFLNAFPEPNAKATQAPGAPDEDSTSTPVDRVHVKIQWNLIKLGCAEGCTVWVPRNDRGLRYKQEAFVRHTVSRLPNFGFDENTRRIVQNIDVLWLNRNVIRRAFEIEASTTIYSGLLRLNDLALAQPNNQIQMHIVASASKRERVRDQLFRPTFRPLLNACEFVTFEAIQQRFTDLETIGMDSGVRISGLIHGERFQLPDHYVYPTTL